MSYSFKVPAPWWLRWWAIAAYLLVLSFAVLAFVRRQRIQVIKKEQEKVRAREMELTAEAALARSDAAEAQTRALEAENNRKALELEKAQELQHAYRELQQAHVNLKRTQAQLVQQEKLASLGQLTAGIAHEIKNPLNFINNFAQLTEELAAELSDAVTAGADNNEIAAIILDLAVNAKKIQEHGQRADGIVRGMLEHARVGDGKRELVHLNRLVDEYVSLASHGMRTQLSDVSIEITRDYADDEIEVEVATQDIGRVLINLLTNALYAVQERALHSNGTYRPRVIVKTEHVDDSVEIHIADNGPGVPAHVRNKIFEPFFTTKPTGSGTGLGLSLAYDIITQGHAGSLTLLSTDGEGATFIIKLPLSVTAAEVV
jgi:signal transduction histidine kinase